MDVKEDREVWHSELERMARRFMLRNDRKNARNSVLVSVV